VAHAYLYVHDLRSSGVVHNAITFAERIARDRPTTLIAGYGDGFFRERAAAGSFALKTLDGPTLGASRLAAAWRLRRWLQTQPPGVLLSAGNLGHRTPYFACRGLDHIARIYRISNEVSRRERLKNWSRERWMRRLMGDAVRIAIVGKALGRLPLFADSLAGGFAVEVPNGVDLDLARTKAAAPAPHRWLTTPEIPVVLGIGRLRPQKNFDLLVDAVGRARRTKRMRLIILGGGTVAEQARLTALAQAAGIGEDFLLAGETDNVFAWLSRAACFALSSRWETSSLALLEALAAGTPAIASRTAGDAAQVLDEGRYGLLFDGADPQALADAILIQSGPDAIRPGERARCYSRAASAEAYAGLVDAAAVALTARQGVRAADASSVNSLFRGKFAPPPPAYKNR
jgi:glycosyltransferase involved in cell wall biosynthesis